jgi:hypothetical protein
MAEEVEEETEQEVCQECGAPANRKVERELRVYEPDPNEPGEWNLHTDEGENIDYYCEGCLEDIPML